MAYLLPPLRQLDDKEQNLINIVTFFQVDAANSDGMPRVISRITLVTYLVKKSQLQKYDLFNWTLMTYQLQSGTKFIPRANCDIHLITLLVGGFSFSRTKDAFSNGQWSIEYHRRS